MLPPEEKLVRAFTEGLVFEYVRYNAAMKMWEASGFTDDKADSGTHWSVIYSLIHILKEAGIQPSELDSSLANLDKCFL